MGGALKGVLVCSESDEGMGRGFGVRTYIDDSILQHRPSNASDTHDILARAGRVVIEEPARSLLVVCNLGRVVAFIQELEHSREDFGLFVRQVDAFARRFEKLRPAGLSEVGRFGEDVFVGCEEAGGGPDGDGDDC